ncbi:MAG: PA2169 family four-helix-bundle protein [Bacteroidetes bacterium]|nr:PA2169 family four-helix-bundle protein [Bacteroidota bacterium]
MIAALNSLITINNDRYEGYTTAAKESKDMDLDKQFFESAGKSKMYAGKLAQYVRELGGEPTEGTTNSGKLYRIWMDVKAAIVAKDRAAILSSCEFGEDAALKAYEEVKENTDLQFPADYIATINSQEMEIRLDHDRIKAMRDAAVESK